MSANVLIIDDDPVQLEILASFLRMLSYDVRLADSGQAGLDAVAAGGIDIILLDVHLPDLPGITVLQKLHEDPVSKDLPIFMITADASPELQIVALSNGAFDFIRKPVDVAELATKIQNAMSLLNYQREIQTLNAKLAKDRHNLSKYFSLDFVEKILNEEITTDLGGSVIDATIMFFDIRGSTTIAEKIGARGYATFINSLFEQLMDIVLRHGGSINQLMGDGILATFGAPNPSTQDAANAIRTAIEIRHAIAAFNADPEKTRVTQMPVGFGLGIATGKIFAGNIGSENLIKYVVMGDPVNLAARLETMTKELSTNLLFDAQTRINANQSTARHVATTTVRGKTMPVDIFTIDD